MAKQGQVDQPAAQADKPERAAGAETVRVRVREGRTVQLDAGRVARGGEWVNVDPAELRVPSFRSAVQTAEEHTEARKTDAERREAAVASGGSSLFDSMRNVARQQHVALRDRDEAAKRAAAQEVGMARELLDPTRPPAPDRPLARELVR